MLESTRYYDISYEEDACRYVACDPIGEYDRVVYFDMDGTIADLYGVDDWLSYLEARRSYPYSAAGDIFDPQEICAFIDNVKGAGWKVGIISWLSKGSDHGYDSEVIAAKLTWINDRLPILDEIIFAAWGSPKHCLTPAQEAILFDDEAPNRIAWEGSGPYRRAYGIEEMGGLFDILASAVEDAESGDYDYTGTGDVNIFDVQYMAQRRFEALREYGMEVPEVDIVHDGERGEWFLSLGVVEGDGETLAEGVVIGDPEHISDEELKQLLTKVDRIVYDLMVGRKIISVY